MKKPIKDAITLAIAKKVLSTVDVGLTPGLGYSIPGHMCVEAAVAYAMGEDHNDHPKCVMPLLANLKIGLNDAWGWDNNKVRAQGLRRVAIAQLGSAEKLKWPKFRKDLKKIIDDEQKQFNIKALQQIKKSIVKLRTTKNEKDVEAAVTSVKGLRWARNFGEVPSKPSDMRNYLCRAAQNYLGVDNHNDQTKILSHAAEYVVQALIKQKIPGTKFLHLTKTKAKALARNHK